MTPSDFAAKWSGSQRTERGQSQEHFIDLCRLLGAKTPKDWTRPPSYTFEKGARSSDGEGFADVWLKGRFAWEYKGKHKDLDAAYRQVNGYREALGNPPLLVLCDLEA